MPFAGNTNTLISKEETEKNYEWYRSTSLYFWSQSAWTAPKAHKYVTELFKEAPKAKEAVKGCLAVVSGVTIGGAGYFMAEELACSAEMGLVILGRNETKLKAAMESIYATAEKRGIEKPALFETKYDLNSLESASSAAAFVEKIAKEKYDGKLHVLINNAGGVTTELGTTEEGIEMNTGRNYVCPHYLTEKLMPLLKAAATKDYKPRCVHVASLGHISGNDFNPEAFLEKPTEGGAPADFFKKSEDGKLEFAGNATMGPPTMYMRAKMGLVADAYALSKKHPEINFTSQQPGSIASNFGSNLGIAGTIYYGMFYPFQFVPSQGARAALRAALDPDFNTEETLQGAYLHADGNPWHPAEPKLENPETKKPFVFEEYAPVCYENTEKLIAKVMKK